MLPVNFLPSARQDYDSSVDWYCDRDAEIGHCFILEIDAAIGRIAAHPLQFPTLDDRHRQCLVKGFPYSVVYRATESTITIVAVAHARRDPGYWKR